MFNFIHKNKCYLVHELSLPDVFSCHPSSKQLPIKGHHRDPQLVKIQRTAHYGMSSPSGSIEAIPETHNWSKHIEQLIMECPVPVDT